LLGIRLKPEEEEMLARHARALGQPKSAVVRQWIRERLERDSIDAQMRRAAEVIATATSDTEREWHDRLAEDWAKALDAEDGGYDWGSEGPPA
jgi:hypothetical protein